MIYYTELEVVPVPEAVPDLGIEAGFPGTVEHVYEGGHRADLEISREDGELIGFVTVDSRPKPHIVAHYVEVESPHPPGLPGEDWSKMYRRFLVGSAGRWIDDPLSTVGSLMVVKAAMYALGMSFEEFGAWVRRVPKDEVHGRLVEEEIVKAFRRRLDEVGITPADDLKPLPARGPGG